MAYIHFFTTRYHRIILCAHQCLFVLALSFVANIAFADLSCLVTKDGQLVNQCKECFNVKVFELRAPGEQEAGHFTGTSKMIEAKPNSSSKLGGTGQWLISDITPCTP